MSRSDEEQSTLRQPTESDRWVQVDTEHYDPLRYLTPSRMASIAIQCRLAKRFFPGTRILEVGVGAGITTGMLRQLGHEVATLDVDPALEPTIVGSVTRIPAVDNAYDVFVCCQVLEHLPWTDAQIALQELARVAPKGGVLSVPSVRMQIGLRIAGAPFSRSRKTFFTAQLPLPWIGRKQISCPEQHAWELGAGVSLRDFRLGLKEAGFKIVKEARPIENPYHHFFVVVPSPIS